MKNQKSNKQARREPAPRPLTPLQLAQARGGDDPADPNTIKQKIVEHVP